MLANETPKCVIKSDTHLNPALSAGSRADVPQPPRNTGPVRRPANIRGNSRAARTRRPSTYVWPETGTRRHQQGRWPSCPPVAACNRKFDIWHAASMGGPGAGDSGIGSPVPPPGNARQASLWRRVRASAKALPPFSYWVLRIGGPLVTALVGLYLVNGLLIGWTEAYEVLLSIRSPFDTSNPVSATFLSIAGWLVTPAVIGAAVGYGVERSIQSHRGRPLRDQ